MYCIISWNLLLSCIIASWSEVKWVWNLQVSVWLWVNASDTHLMCGSWHVCKCMVKVTRLTCASGMQLCVWQHVHLLMSCTEHDLPYHLHHFNYNLSLLCTQHLIKRSPSPHTATNSHVQYFKNGERTILNKFLCLICLPSWERGEAGVSNA